MSDIYYVVTLVVLALLASLVVKVGVDIISKSRTQRILYMRNFKSGNGALIYLIVIPLLVMGKMYDGATFFTAFFESITKSIELIVLNFSFSSVASLMAQLPIYAVTVYLSYGLIVINAVMLTISLFQQHFWAFRQKVSFSISKKQKLVLVGYNEENIAIYKSEKNRLAFIVGEIPKQDKQRLYMENIRFVNCSKPNELISRLMDRAIDNKGESRVVINTLDDHKNTELCRIIAEQVNGKSEQNNFIKLLDGFRAYVYGDPNLEAIYVDFENQSMGGITYLNKYRQIAIDFVDKYPFTKFMGGDKIGDDFLVKDGVNINAVMVGFGKTNRQLFLTSVANNQFLTKRNDNIELKKVNYYVFDCADSRNDKNLNHNYYRFAEELKNANASDYLPLPDEPANDEFYFKLDVNDFKFYSAVHDLVGKNPNDVNFLIVAFGNDLENLDMAQKLMEKKKEWGIKNLILFVKTRAAFKGHRLFDDPDCYPFGIEKECVYDIERITNDSLTQMAKWRNRIYAIESAFTSGKTDESKVISDADLGWYTKKTQAERESNVYACLSIKSKLNIMGLTYVKNGEEGDALTKEQYLSVYAAGDRVNYRKVGSDEFATYSLDFPQSNRKTMAIHEHYRWNSYMISKGFVPATKKEILTETTVKNGKTVYTNGKNYALRNHGNLTTFDGLAQFSKLIALRDGVDESQTDVIKYDYQLLDDLYLLLTKCGYKIVKR